MCNFQIYCKIDAEERLIKSPSSVRYDDQLWHKLDLLRIGRRVDVRVDGKDVLSEDIFDWRAENVLKIDLGVFLGGYGTSNLLNTSFDTI